MIRYLALVFTISLQIGCVSRPIQTVLRGAMHMNGAMDVRGDMNMAGKLSTVIATDNTASRLKAVPVYGENTPTLCKRVAVLDVDGFLVNKNIGGMGSMGENPVSLFREKLDALVTDGSVGAIVVRINSPGGGVTAADVMTRDLLNAKRQLQVPVVACLMDVGAAGGYYLSTAADLVVAHPTSIVGGIGVIFNSYLIDEEMSTFGFTSRPIVAGEKINAATPDRPYADGELEILQGIADEFHGRFIQRVKNRPSMSTQVGARVLDDELFDGRVMTGRQAMESGLVDQVGYLDDAVLKACELAGLPPDAQLVMLRRDNDRAYTLLDVTPNSPTMSSLIPIKIPALDRAEMPSFLYLWQPEPSMATGL